MPVPGHSDAAASSVGLAVGATASVQRGAQLSPQALQQSRCVKSPSQHVSGRLSLVCTLCSPRDTFARAQDGATAGNPWGSARSFPDQAQSKPCAAQRHLLASLLVLPPLPLAVAFRKTFGSCCTFYLQWPPCKAKQKNVCRSSHPVVRRSMLLSAVQELLNAKLTRHEAKLERFVKLTHAEQSEDGVSTGGLGERQGCLTYREMQWAQAYETQRRPSLVCPCLCACLRVAACNVC